MGGMLKFGFLASSTATAVAIASVHFAVLAQAPEAPTPSSPEPSPSAQPAVPNSPNPSPSNQSPAPAQPAPGNPEQSPATPAQPNATDALLQEQGTLEQGDAIASDNSLYDRYTFEGDEGQRVTLTMESSEFDTYLVLVDPEGQLLGDNDNVSQQNSNSSLTVTLPVDGTYTVIANGRDNTSQGRYTVNVTSEQ